MDDQNFVVIVQPRGAIKHALRHTVWETSKFSFNFDFELALK